MTLTLVDLFAGAGGCSVGYARAGFVVVNGVDVTPHDDYPFDLIVDDAIAWLDRLLAGQVEPPDVVHASPPCPRFAAQTADRDRHPDLLTPTLDRLRAWGGTWIVENVPRAPLPGALQLCGRAFGLDVRRHRLFASSPDVFLMGPPCACDHRPPVGVYGRHADNGNTYQRPNGGNRGRKAATLIEAQQAMGIDWMTSWDDLKDAIPPAFTQLIGEQIVSARRG